MASLKELFAAKQAAAAPAPTTGIKIKPDPVKLPPVVQQELPSIEARQLGNMERGADVPFEFASEKDSEAARMWLEARQLPESSLCLVMEPGETSEYAWIALQTRADIGRPLLLFRLPLAIAKNGPGVPY